jgi:hypothetical protein
VYDQPRTAGRSGVESGQGGERPAAIQDAQVGPRSHADVDSSHLEVGAWVGAIAGDNFGC